MVQIDDQACHGGSSRLNAHIPTRKLLFSHGRFERSSPTKKKPINGATPSPSSNIHSLPHYLSSRMRLLPSTTGYGEPRDQQAAAARSKGLYEEEDEECEACAGSNNILHKFSILAEGILSIWEGEDSVRRRIEVLGERLLAMQQEISGAEKVQRDLRERLGALEESSAAEMALLERLKKERLRTLGQNGKASTGLNSNNHQHQHLYSSRIHGDQVHNLQQGLDTLPCISNGDQKHKLHEELSMKQTTKPADNGPSLAAGSVFSSRQMVAFEMLEFAHKRLTSHMWAHMCGRVKEMKGEEERGEYLRVFRGVEGESVFGVKPLSEATYGELLEYYLTCKKGVEIRKEVEEALKAAEGRLGEEASSEGYGEAAAGGGLGDIRKQMTAYLHCYRYFRAAMVGGRWRNNGQETSANNTMDIILDTQRAAAHGRLGILQPAFQLIQLGCYFLCKSSRV